MAGLQEGVTLEMTHITIPESITLALDPQRDEARPSPLSLSFRFTPPHLRPQPPAPPMVLRQPCRLSSVLQDIAQVCKCIEAAGRAGLRGINYNFCVLPHQSTERSSGRGGVSYRTFKLEEYTTPTFLPFLPPFRPRDLTILWGQV